MDADVSTLPIAVGARATFSKTVGETDIYLFAGISGDFARNHVDEEFMTVDGRGGRIAHGALMIAFMSTASTRICEAVPDDSPVIPASLGYDRVRFVKPVMIGDTVTVDYRVAEVDPEAMRTRSDITVTNQRGETVAVATHILKFIRREKLFS